MAIAFDANLGSFSQNTTGTTIALTTSAAAAAGSRLIAIAHWSSPTVTASMAGGGLTWAKADERNNGNFRVAVFYASAPGGLASSTVLTVTLSGTPGASGFIAAASFTGLDGPVNVSTFANQGSGTTWTASITNTWPDALVFGVTEADTSTTGSNTPSSGTEIHDFTNTGYAAAIATEYLIVSARGSNTISGTWAGLTGNSEKITVLVVFQDRPAVVRGSFLPRQLGPKAVGPTFFAALQQPAPVVVVGGGTPVTFVMDAMASATAAGIVPAAVQVRPAPPVAAATASAANPVLRAIVKPVLAAATAAGLVPIPRVRTAPPVAGATAAGLAPAKLTARVTSLVAGATGAGLIPTPRVRTAPPIGAATAAGQAPGLQLVVHAVTATATASAGAPLEPGGGTGAAPQYIGLKSIDEHTVAVYAHGRRKGTH